MLDENLPTFLLKPSSEKPKQHSTFYYSQYGSDFEPSYTLRHLDPEQHSSRNRYAVGLYDAYNPEILFAEVLLVPEWTQLTLSAEQIRLNGGVPPPPEPILPLEFAVQLYNPDQQIIVKHKPATFKSVASWEFEMPTQTFREPSSSALDRSQHDPVASELTPKIRLRWKKDGKFNKDLTCFQSGRSLNADGSKKKYKEPDITVAILKNLKELTLYESNLARVEVEDIKGLEVVLLIGAVVIRDVYFAPMKETFNLAAGRKSSGGSPAPVLDAVSPLPTLPIRQSPAQLPVNTARDNRVPPTDPRTQWEIDVETARLKKIAAEEDKEQKRQEEAEQRRIKKMLEVEDKERRRREAEIEKETVRLQKLYGREDASARPALPYRPVTQPPTQYPSPDSRRQSAYTMNRPSSGPGSDDSYGLHGNPNLYMSGAASQSTLLAPLSSDQQKLKQKSSIFGFRRNSDQSNSKLQKKKSAVF